MRWLDPARPFGRDPRLVAALIWAVTLGIFATMLLTGHLRTISYLVYATAGRRWSALGPIYEAGHIEGFQYFPHAAIFFVPFAWMGSPTGDLAWRVLSWGTFAWGMWRVVRELAQERAGECFVIATPLSLAVATGPLKNGQANLMLAALMLHVAAELVMRRWWRATVVIALGLALKPQMAVLLLLVWVLYRPMYGRMPVALVLLAVAPFAAGPADYVIAQWSACWDKLALSAIPPPTYEDLRGLLATFGWTMPHRLSTAIALVAALGVLIACYAARRRLRDPYATVLVVGFAATYLMLFNARTQSTSYTMPVAIASVLAGSYLIERRRGAVAMMVAVLVGWSINHHWVAAVELWLKPLSAAVFGAWLVREVIVPADRWRPTTASLASDTTTTKGTAGSETPIAKEPDGTDRRAV